MPSFSDITDFSTTSRSFRTDRSRTPLFHVVQYGDDIMGRKLNLKTAWLVVVVEPTTFQTAATDDDKD